MKIKPEDLTALRAVVAPHDTTVRRAKYLVGDFPGASRVRDLNKRYRWDVLYASGLKIGDGRGIPGDINLYAYLDDSHIDTALRTFIPNLLG